MHAHEVDGIDVEVGRRGADGAREPSAAMPGLAERRPDVLSSAAMLRLQREAGNGAVSELVEEQRSPVHDVDLVGRLDARARGAHRHGVAPRP